MEQNEKNREQKQAVPTWYKDNRIDELALVETIRREGDYRCVGGVFYDGEEKPVEESVLLNKLTDRLSRVGCTGLNRKSRDLLSLMRARWNTRLAEPDESVIHVVNGTIYLMQKRFTEEKVFTLQRLPVPYYREAQRPLRFLQFLDDLLYSQDIPTLQEYMGYCLIPTNRAQKMLIISGRGGEGKSVLGRVFKMLLGPAAVCNSIQKISTNAFARADLEQKLVMIDDDMSTSALSQTHYLKTLVTLEGETDLEKKGQQSYQGRIYTRFLGLSNGGLTALYDHSDGFFRRQILLEAKPRDKDRVDDPYLTDYLVSELPGIFLWSLQGLARLMKNDFRFTISDRARENLNQSIREADSVRAFFESKGYIRFDPKGCASSADLTATYRRFCQENDMLPLNDATFRLRMSQQAEAMGLQQTKHIPTQNRKDIRGYLGIALEVPAAW